MSNMEKQLYYVKLSAELSKISCKLKRANFPLHGGLNDNCFPIELRDDARRLHIELSKVFVTNHNPNTEYLTYSRFDLKEAFKIILAGNLPIAEYVVMLKSFDSSKKCNVVWPVDSVAYRCSTCAFNPCMSLCAKCFLNGNHKDHDYNRFFSLAGGACDCGNDDVLDSKGFCQDHDINHLELVPPPFELIALPEFVFTKLFVHLLNLLRNWSKKHEEYVKTQIQFQTSLILAISEHIYVVAEEIVYIIKFFLDQSGLIVDIMASILLDEKLYADLNCSDFKEDNIIDLSTSQANLQQDLNSLHAISCPISFYSHIGGRLLQFYINNRGNKINCKCLLDELEFYLIRLTFPQTFLNVLISLLPNKKFKERFSLNFFGNYCYIAEVAVQLMETISSQPEEIVELSSRIVHTSVQISSSLKICKMLHEKIQIIDKIFDAGVKVMLNDSKPIQLNHSPNTYFEQVYINTEENNLNTLKYYNIDVEGNKCFSKFGYSFLVTDMQNIFSHLELAETLICDLRFCEKYAHFIGAFQGINLLWRVVRGNHIDTDKLTVSTRSFTLEWDCSAAIMFNTLAILQKKPHRNSLAMVLKTFTQFLKTFFNAINLKNGYDIHHLQCPAYTVTFHLPLHRHLGYALWQSISTQEELEYSNVILNFAEDEQFLRLYVQHPVRIHVVRAEYFAGMWVRNGALLRHSVNLYDQSTFTFGFQIPDTFTIRFCAANMNQEFFLNYLYYSFHLNDCFCYKFGAEIEFENLKKTVITSVQWIPFMFDGYLRLLLEMLAHNVHGGLSSENNLRAELVCVLSFGSFTHSKLKLAVPNQGLKVDKDYSPIFDKVLEEVADYEMPDQGNNIRQGQYKLKELVWLNEFDPVLCRTRCSSAKEFNSIMMKTEEREMAHWKVLKGVKYVEDRQTHAWIGYRLFNFDTLEGFEIIKPVWGIFTQPTFFYTMHFILKQCLIFDPEQNIVLQEVIYLLNLAIKFIISENLINVAKNCLYHIGNLPKEGAEFCTENGEKCTSKLLHTPFHCIEVRDSLNIREAILSFFTCNDKNHRSILSLLLEHFEKNCHILCPKSSMSDIYYELMHNYIFVDVKSLDRVFGSAKEYFGRLLCYLYKSDILSRKVMDELYEMHVLLKAEKQLENVILDSNIPSVSSVLNEPTINSEVKFLAKRKQEAILNSQKMKHARLMQKMMIKEGLTQAEMNEMDTKPQPDIKKQHAVVYECPICNDQSTCTLNNLMGVMVLIQPNKLLDCVIAKQDRQESLMDIGNFRKITGILVVNRMTKAKLNFARDFKLNEVYYNKARFTRFFTGVGVRTCGHTAHLACYKAYVDTLNLSQHHPAFPTENIYSCPMCRQPVNSILPLKPELSFERIRLPFKIGAQENIVKTAELIRNLIVQKRFLPSLIEDELNKQMLPYFSQFSEFEDMCRKLSTVLNRGSEKYLLSPSEDFTFQGYRNKTQSQLLGIIRTSIDYQLVLKRKGMPLIGNQNRKFSIIKHLIYKSRLTHDFFMDEFILDEFFKFMGDKTLFPDVNLINVEKESAPFLLYDEKSFLCLIYSFILPDENLIELDKFDLCIFVYRLLLCLKLCNVVLQVFFRISKDAVLKLFSGSFFREYALRDTKHQIELAQICDFVCEAIKCRLNLFYNHMFPVKVSSSKMEDELADKLLTLSEFACTDFTRFAIVLLDEHNLSEYFAAPNVKSILPEAGLVPGSSSSQMNVGENFIIGNIFDLNFIELFKMLTSREQIQIESSTSTSVENKINLVDSIRFARNSILAWIHHLDQTILVKNVNDILSHQILEWHKPRILELPNSYDELFALFLGSKCGLCGLVPSSPMICLVCGELCCLDRCCNATEQVSEVEKHTYTCTFGCGCFLALHSSSIVIVRNAHALIWGSVYLDSYGEEDRNLKRGKPLFLSAHRLQRLEEDWLRQSFVRKGSISGFRNWMMTENLWQILRDSYHYN